MCFDTISWTQHHSIADFLNRFDDNNLFDIIIIGGGRIEKYNNNNNIIIYIKNKIII